MIEFGNIRISLPTFFKELRTTGVAYFYAALIGLYRSTTITSSLFVDASITASNFKAINYLMLNYIYLLHLQIATQCQISRSYIHQQNS